MTDSATGFGRAFPPGFLFGAAVSAHQVEGGNDNDWTAWEPGHVPEVSGAAVDHYHRYREDLRLAASLGLDAFRFSVEWARVEPRPGVYDPDALQHYSDVVDACRELGLEPMITLNHFTLPRWVATAGGWSAPEVAERFGIYCGVVGQALRGRVESVCTLNEPEVLSMKTCLAGVWPGGGRLAVRRYLRVRRGLADGHRLATAALRQADSRFSIGYCCSQNPFVATTSVLEPVARAASRLYNDWFLDRLTPTCDWLGVQYYNRVAVGPRRGPDVPRSDMGWPLVPELHGPVLESLSRYGLPLYVTESGLADADDSRRTWYIEATLRSLAEALTAGVDVRGYLHWSLLDNYEWDHGFGPRFGLVEVDRRTMERRVRASARRYAELIDTIRHAHA
ncbi:glycoside hydrolase family 1 protein [Spongisporangium articulatum]|uniref:Glycoside hydrolase family 1 protein n=1 Tax=Spongisporangium articulatum TaxID=3362603 RepID=A0ABW8AMB4_9ACTN